MALEDLISKFESFTNPAPDAEAPDIDAVLAGVTEVYNNDMSIRDHAVQQREAAIAELKKQNDTLKTANYDLLMKQPQGNVVPDKQNEPDTDDEAERAATIKVSDLFTKRK